MTRTSLLALCAGPLLLIATPANAQPVFTEIAAGTSLELPGVLVESVAFGDYNNDGLADVYLTIKGDTPGAIQPNRLYRNDGGGSFTDVTLAAGLGTDQAFSVGAAWGDLDNDGDLDLYVVNFAGGRDELYRNNGPVGPGGEHTFTNVAGSTGLTATDSSRGVTLLDYNRDGLLDVYVNAIGEQILYINSGNMTFTNVAGLLQIDDDVTGVGVVASDLDDNGWPDLFVGNRSFDPNSVYLNDCGTFSDITDNGVGATGLGMGVIAFDYDNDLDMDLYWTTWPGADPTPVDNALYENVPSGNTTNFVNVTGASGTADALGWGISANVGDIDNDGFEDFFVTNGFSPASTANVLFHNQGDGTFTDITTSLAGGGLFDGRGVAFADIDNDGDLDLFVTTDVETGNRLWRNDTITSNHWLQVKLATQYSNRAAVGARVWVYTPTRHFVKEVSGGAGRGSQNSLLLEFGLGSETQIDTIVVRWPNGHEQTYSGNSIAVDSRITLTEASPGPPSAELCACNRGLDNCDPAATCTNVDNSFECMCPTGTAGDGTACADIDECLQATSVCDANEVCVNTFGSFSCPCDDGYERNAEGDCVDIDECALGATVSGCAPEATCLNLVGSVSCSCGVGFAGDGATCFDIDECLALTDNCAAEAVCSNTHGGFECACDGGWTGDGVTCTDVDECAAGTDTCDGLATCTNTVGGFECACDAGYQGNGETCFDIDECLAGTADCGANAGCVNTLGGFECACSAGYEADPNDASACVDVDECAAGTATCGTGLSCVNTDGGFTCSACAAGYEADGAGGCVDIDECQSAGACAPEATCSNTDGGFECACGEGYTGNGSVCIDVDECAVGSDTCGDAETCRNTDGGFACDCAAGYVTGDDGSCSDVDECADGTNDCAEGATCTNVAGGFECACPAGFTGDGRVCVDVDECAASAPCGDNADCTNTPGGFACECEVGFKDDGADGCEAACGDGVIDRFEQCDDGNTSSGDGCSATCFEEAGFRCTDEPSACEVIDVTGSFEGGDGCSGGEGVPAAPALVLVALGLLYGRRQRRAVQPS